MLRSDVALIAHGRSLTLNLKLDRIPHVLCKGAIKGVGMDAASLDTPCRQAAKPGGGNSSAAAGNGGGRRGGGALCCWPRHPCQRSAHLAMWPPQSPWCLGRFRAS